MVYRRPWNLVKYHFLNQLNSFSLPPWKNSSSWPYHWGIHPKTQNLGGSELGKTMHPTFWPFDRSMIPMAFPMLFSGRKKHQNRSQEYIDTLMILAKAGAKLLASQPVLVAAQVPCRIFGDLHGQLRDLLLLFAAFGFPGSKEDTVDDDAILVFWSWIHFLLIGPVGRLEIDIICSFCCLLFLMNNYGFLAVIPFDKIRQPQNRESTRKSQTVISFCPWKQKRCRMSYVFNGDFVDRGAHSLEVIGLLLALKVSMPNRIWLVRGNHEDRTHGPTPRRNVSNVSSVWWNIWNHRGAGWPTFFTISGLI